ncbi:hypothetical protein ACFQGT_09760 [Natrialbaceae archaeon GCM10025810]|uniref:hypothetical protein n=1 Tax=Halovalidus salilacus TaxID=3075124 RepID=UPI0036128F0E
MFRRAILGTFGAVGLSGCFSSIPTSNADTTATLWNQSGREKEVSVTILKNGDKILNDDYTLEPDESVDLVKLSRDLYRVEIESGDLFWEEEFDITEEEEGIDIFNIHLYDDDVSVNWGVED